MEHDCFVNMEGEMVSATFVGVFQRSQVFPPSPMRGGHSGGTVAYPIAVVKINGEFREVKLDEVTFSE